MVLSRENDLELLCQYLITNLALRVLKNSISY